MWKHKKIKKACFCQNSGVKTNLYKGTATETEGTWNNEGPARLQG